MDHAIIDENHIAERFVLGRLDAEEARLFEEHFLDCAECLERVELAERLQAGLQRAAVRRAAAVATAAAVAGAGALAWRRRLFFGLALLLALTLPTVLLLPRVRRLDHELAAARASQPSPPPATRAKPPEVAVPPAGAPQAAAALAAAEREAKRLAEELERARAPQVNVPILALSLVRSGAGEEGPAARLQLPKEAPWAVISLEPSDPGFPSYRATLHGADGRVRWQAGGLALASSGLLSWTLPRRLLAPGSYTLEVEGRPASGPPVPAGTFRFDVVP